VETAHAGEPDHAGSAGLARFGRPADRRVTDRGVNALGVVVVDVFLKQSSQVGFIQHHHMIEQLPANRADEALRRPVLPGALERRALGMETETLDRLGDRWAEDRVVVVDQKPMQRRVEKRFAQLLGHPPSSWTRGDAEGKNASPSVIERKPDIEQPEAHRRHDEEVHSRDHVSVIPKEGGPALL
jgi:hypothetical protein